MKKKSVGKNLSYATKNDLDSLAKQITDKFDYVIKFFKNELDSAFDAMKHQNREEFDELKQRIDFLPTKDEYYTSMDKLMGEIQTSRDSQIILNGRTSEHSDTLEDHEERITKLEHLPQAP